MLDFYFQNIKNPWPPTMLGSTYPVINTETVTTVPIAVSPPVITPVQLTPAGNVPIVTNSEPATLGAQLTPEGNVPIGANPESAASRTQLTSEENVPIVANPEPATSQAQFTPEENVPIVTNTTNISDAGLTLEKTINNVDTGCVYGPVTKEEAEMGARDTEFVKQIPGFSVLPNDEERGRSVANNLISTPINISDKKLQFKAFKYFNSHANSPISISILSKAIGFLNKDIRVSAADEMLDNKQLKDKLRNLSNNAVIQNIKNYGQDNELPIQKLALEQTSKESKILLAQETQYFAEKNQVQATENIVATNDKDIVDAWAKVSYNAGKNDHTIQFGVAETLYKSGFEQVQKTIAQNEGKYAVENQISVYKMLMTSDYDSVLKEAGSNIHTMQKENQLSAIDITIKMDKKVALEAAAAQINSYEDKEAVRAALMSTNYDSVKQEIIDKEATQPDVAIVQETVSVPKVEENSITTDKTEIVKEVYEIIGSKKTDKEKLINDVVGKATESQKLDLLEQFGTDPTVIKAILNSHPSPMVLSKIMQLLDTGTFDTEVKKDLIEAICSTGIVKNIIWTQFSPELQTLFINSLEQKDLGFVKEEYLSLPAKDAYKKRLENSQHSPTGTNRKFGGLIKAPM